MSNIGLAHSHSTCKDLLNFMAFYCAAHICCLFADSLARWLAGLMVWLSCVHIQIFLFLWEALSLPLSRRIVQKNVILHNKSMNIKVHLKAMQWPFFHLHHCYGCWCCYRRPGRHFGCFHCCCSNKFQDNLLIFYFSLSLDDKTMVLLLLLLLYLLNYFIRIYEQCNENLSKWCTHELNKWKRF